VRKRSFAPGILFIVFALALPALIIAQQSRSARRATATTNPERASTGGGVAPGRTSPTGQNIKSDLAEALAVIQSNHIDGRKLDYNSIFKSSISGMLSVLDPHSTYFDPVEYASFRTEQRSEYFGIGATIEDLREGSTSTLTFAPPSRSPSRRAGLRLATDSRRRRQLDEGQDLSGSAKVFARTARNDRQSHCRAPATKATETVSIVRDAVSLPSIAQAYMLRPASVTWR
jgi:carboxyl-terminal processing protease